MTVDRGEEAAEGTAGAGGQTTGNPEAKASAERVVGGAGDERAVDVLIVGGGLAGLTLARQLLLRSDKRVLLIDRKELPPKRQKVGEATVQVSGYYYARVLEMEEHLLREHFLKYNLRFYWKTEAGADRYEGYSQSFIRGLSNIATYQLDRNKFEAAVLRVNQQSPRFELHAPASELTIDLAEDGEEGAKGEDSGDGEGGEDGEKCRNGRHSFSFRSGDRRISGTAAWVVDASGRGRVLARRRGLAAPSPIRHGSTFFWVDGLIDFERLTDLSAAAVRKRPDRAALGHLPVFLATNHFCGEGYWFWLIPLHGMTSLGLVYDSALVPRAEVATPQKLIAWVCRQFPLFARDLPGRRIVDFGGFTDFALDSTQTISPARWAMVGEACRFSDPLYSPGGDLISIYNTLITDAILTDDREQLASKVRVYEQLARAVYEAYVPSFAVSYEVLGDQEVFTLRYAWELTIYFAFYVFPFINDLFTDRQFVPSFLRSFSRLGPINRSLHAFLVGYYRWKKENLEPAGGGGPRFFDFYEFAHLKAAEACFYRVGLSALEARPVLAEQLENIEELARFMVAHATAVVTGDRRALGSEFVGGIDLRRLEFDPAAMAARVAACNPADGEHPWRLQPAALERFRQQRRAEAEPAGEAEREAAAAGAG
jgi:flavin-dependent dehydrogenase